eukprot:gene5629-biopygen2676
MGLQSGRVYDSVKDLRYGRIMVMTDQDVDGSHIKRLVFNLFHQLWPSLLAIDDEKKSDSSRKSWTAKYYKGLGTSTSEEAREYFRELRTVTYHIATTRTCPDALSRSFDKRPRERSEGVATIIRPTTTLDYQASQQMRVCYGYFIDKDLKHFSNYDVLRSVPSVVDGLKVSQQSSLRLLQAMRSPNDNFPEARVAQLAAYVSEHSLFHHGEASMQGTIIAMAQNFVGAGNNLNLLQPIGQFGSRLGGGSDHASPRYIHTCVWIDDFKETLENFVGDNAKGVKGFSNESTEDNVSFTITFSNFAMASSWLQVNTTQDSEAHDDDIGYGDNGSHASGDELKMYVSKPLCMTNMHLFDASGRIRKYSSPEEILDEFLERKVRFVELVVTGELDVFKEVVDDDNDDDVEDDDDDDDDSSGLDSSSMQQGPVSPDAKERKRVHALERHGLECVKGSFRYLLSMPVSCLTRKRKDALERERDARRTELEAVRDTDEKDMYVRDLERLEKFLIKECGGEDAVAHKFTADGNAWHKGGMTADVTNVNSIKLGNKWSLSGVGDKHGNDDWLRLFNKDGTGYYGGLAAGRLWSGGATTLDGPTYTKDITASGKLNVQGGNAKVCVDGACITKGDINTFKAAKGSISQLQHDLTATTSLAQTQKKVSA